MRKRLLVAVLLCVPALLNAQFRASLQDLDDSETVRALKEHVAYLSGAQLEGRKAGSEGEKMAAEYLEERFREYGLDVLPTGVEFKLAHGTDTLTSRNVMGFLQGWDKNLNGRYIVVGARMDNLGMDVLTVDGQAVPRIYYGANGNASGMALMLELAQKLSYARTLLRRSILFVGFGASEDSFAGAWYFLHRAFESDADKVDAMVNLDMLGTSDNGFFAYTASNKSWMPFRENYFRSRQSRQRRPRIPETIRSSTMRRFLRFSLLRAVIPSTEPAATATILLISRGWRRSWSISTAMCSTWPTDPVRSSGTTLLLLPVRRMWPRVFLPTATLTPSPCS